MVLNPRTLTRHARLICLILTLAGGIYLYRRYELFDLPQAGCSPVSRYSPGARLLLDRRPPRLESGDGVLFAAGDEVLYLGLVDRTRGGSDLMPAEVWIQTDVEACPGPDSDEFGWIPVEGIRARVMMVIQG